MLTSVVFELMDRLNRLEISSSAVGVVITLTIEVSIRTPARPRLARKNLD